MTNPEHFYDVEKRLTNRGIKYLFVSKGEKDIIKVIEYAYVQPFIHGHVFNLAFGDYDAENDRILDDPLSNNGDQYRVFNTVLNTIPNFFSYYSTAIMAVQGSDSKEEFIENCKTACTRRCGQNECRKAHRRINIYRSYVEKNFSALSENYVFLGGKKDSDNQINIEPYALGQKYNIVLVHKKLYL